MKILPVNKMFCSLLLLFAAACVLQPVLADNGTISIAYRGAGGSYVGDTVVFDGKNTYGNTTLIKITGPGLPADGLPANNLNGAVGTGTPVEGDQYGAWKFGWYASSVPGVEKLKTGRYTFTATDSADPGKSATTLFMLKKPEYSITASPNPVTPGSYIELNGVAEAGITTAKIDITDASGRVMHTYTSPVSSSGYFNYGFHEDMGPGQYQVKVSNPALKAPFGTVLSVVAEGNTTPVAIVMTTEPVSRVPTTGMTEVATPAPVTPTIPAKSPVALVTVLAALVAGLVISGISRR
jgi:hypothetical protein